MGEAQENSAKERESFSGRKTGGTADGCGNLVSYRVKRMDCLAQDTTGEYTQLHAGVAQMLARRLVFAGSASL